MPELKSKGGHGVPNRDIFVQTGSFLRATFRPPWNFPPAAAHLWSHSRGTFRSRTRTSSWAGKAASAPAVVPSFHCAQPRAWRTFVSTMRSSRAFEWRSVIEPSPLSTPMSSRTLRKSRRNSLSDRLPSATSEAMRRASASIRASSTLAEKKARSRRPAWTCDHPAESNFEPTSAFDRIFSAAVMVRPPPPGSPGLHGAWRGRLPRAARPRTVSRTDRPCASSWRRASRGDRPCRCP